MVLANRSRYPSFTKYPQPRLLDREGVGLEVGLFLLISGGTGVALLWFVAQGEASSYLYPHAANPSPALSRPAPVAPAAKPCIDRGGEATTTAKTCPRMN